MNSGVYVVNWYDNKFVHPASTFSGVNATGSVKRWDSKAKNHKYVPLPYGFRRQLNNGRCQHGWHVNNLEFKEIRNHDEKALVFETDFLCGRHLQGQWLATLSSFLWPAADSKENSKAIIDIYHWFGPCTLTFWEIKISRKAKQMILILSTSSW